MQEQQQERKGSKAVEEKEFEPEEEEAQEAKGNSVFDAPVMNLAAGLQLGFTPSTAGTPLVPPATTAVHRMCCEYTHGLTVRTIRANCLCCCMTAE